MKLRIAVKASPASPTATAAPPDPAEGPAALPDQQQADDSRPWAGDPYDEGDETPPDDPSVTAVFAGEGDEQAWLERASDGTLTGWVRDGTGQVWRYTDPDAWAVDVDDAKMSPQSGGAAPKEDQAQPPESEDGKQPQDDPGALTLDGFK